MKTLKRVNQISERHPGKTVLICIVLFALACVLLPADPPYVGVIAGVAK